MTDKYQNKYRIASARLQNWDYGSNALYFVTICTKNREHFFGNIVETQNIASPSKMQLSAIGKIANDCWLQIPEHFPFVVLHNHVIMPNHVHGIIEIAKSNNGDAVGNVVDDAVGNVETQNFASLPPQPQPPQPKNKFGPQSKNLASIIRGYKIGVTKNARIYEKTQNIAFKPFAWQPRFHDHIIRNDKSYQNISNYITNNPSNWKGDKFHSKN